MSYRLCLFSAFLITLGSLSAQEQTLEKLRDAELGRYNRLMNREPIPAAMDSYDVKHYRLNVAFPYPSAQFSGDVIMTFTSKASGLKAIELHAGANLTIDSVKLGNIRQQISKAGEVLTVTLYEALEANQSTSLHFFYSAAYTNSAIVIREVNQVVLGGTTTSLASQAEPYDARKWWPCKDDPSDKADSVDLIYTVSDELFPVGNGLMISDSDNGNGTRTVHWKSHYPIVTYLVSVAAANYSHNSLFWDYRGDQMPVGSWWYGMTKNDMSNHENTMLDGLSVLSDLFIKYPFSNEKYGMAEYEWGGAMEHQTVSSMGFYGQDVVIHELAHQWFGDKATCATFEHIWLNEGWATYCEALYREAKGGLPALKAKMATTKWYGSGKIFVDDPENNRNRIFNSNLSYRKASWVLHMLRHVVGDEVFFTAVRKYLGSTDRDAYRSVVTEEFQTYVETESGMDLDPFFQNWIHGEYFPTYRFDWSTSQSGSVHTVDVRIEQILNPATQLFTLPIDLTFDFGSWDTTIVVQNSEQVENYTFQFAENPRSVVLDKDDWILKQVQQRIPNPTFDHGILLVNGVDWDESAYTADIKAAFADSIFTGNKPYTFWDIFPNPRAGYPSNITSPNGSGTVPVEEIGKYCTVVWVGNAYNGDDAIWSNTQIWEYIKAGGNVILITRSGRTFIAGSLQQFLGIQWDQNNQTTIRNSIAQYPGLSNITFTGDQTLVSPFLTTLTRPENSVLFVDDTSYANPVGTGIWARPQIIDGKKSGQMVYLAMRPYRVARSTMKKNMQVILDSIPCSVPVSVERTAVPQSLSLSQNYPNPLVLSAGSQTTITYGIPAYSQHVTLRVYDALGRIVSELVNDARDAGTYSTAFDANSLAPGVYSYHLTSANQRLVRSMVILR